MIPEPSFGSGVHQQVICELELIIPQLILIEVELIHIWDVGWDQLLLQYLVCVNFP